MPNALARCLALLAMFVVATTASAQGTGTQAITIGAADSIWSPTLQERREYLVYTPPSYDVPTRVPRAYPVLYLLDGDLHFHSVTGLLQILSSGVNFTFSLPEMIVVAIPNTDRRRDLTPTRISRDAYGNPLPPGWETTGGNPAFLRFLESELIPHIDSAYRTAPYRVLVGHSLGGLAVINALYTTPRTFNAFVAIDPMVWFDDRLLVRQARDVFAREAPAGRTFYLAQSDALTPYDSGTAINYHAIRDLHGIASASTRSGIRYGYKFYTAEDHGSLVFPAEFDALRFIFEGYKSDIPRAAQEPGYLTAHFERLSRRFGYRVLPPAMLAEFAVELGSMAAQGAAGTRSARDRVTGTWALDSTSEPLERTTSPQQSLIVEGTDDGLRLTTRAGGPAGPSLTSFHCTTRHAATPSPGDPEACGLEVAADTATYSIRRTRDGRLVSTERGILTVSADGRTLYQDVSERPAKGSPVRRRRVFSRLY